MKTAVIVTTYNRPDALRAALEGYRRAGRHATSSSLIADDGSTRRHARAHRGLRARARRFPLTHVWQEDRGFRAGAARNRALAQTRRRVRDLQRRRLRAAAFLREPPPRARRAAAAFSPATACCLSEAFTADGARASACPIHRWSTARWLRGVAEARRQPRAAAAAACPTALSASARRSAGKA